MLDSVPLSRAFFETDPVNCAQRLIGCQLEWGPTSGTIVETEAYAELGDEAAHTFFRKGAREFVVKNVPGTLYVYLNYGVHWLLNFLVKSPQGNGFVLIRALEPMEGLEIMRRRRRLEAKQSLCSGPGKLSQALGIGPSFHGKDFFQVPEASIRSRSKEVSVEIDRRIGITRGIELEWRFLLARSPYLSRQKTRPRAN